MTATFIYTLILALIYAFKRTILYAEILISKLDKG